MSNSKAVNTIHDSDIFLLRLCLELYWDVLGKCFEIWLASLYIHEPSQMVSCTKWVDLKCYGTLFHCLSNVQINVMLKVNVNVNAKFNVILKLKYKTNFQDIWLENEEYKP